MNASTVSATAAVFVAVNITLIWPVVSVVPKRETGLINVVGLGSLPFALLGRALAAPSRRRRRAESLAPEHVLDLVAEWRAGNGTSAGEG